MKETFCQTPAWITQWPNVEKILKTPEFKQIVVTERKAIKHKVSEDQIINYCTKIELGVLAIIWCSGTQQAKAEFLFNLASSGSEQSISWSDEELKLIFVKLLQFATDLPLRYTEAFGEITDENIQFQNLFSIEEIIKEEIDPINDLDDKYTEFYYDWFIDQIFPEFQSDCSK